MKVNYYVFPDTIPMDEMKNLAVEYNLTVYYQREGWVLSPHGGMTEERKIELIITNPPAPIERISHEIAHMTITEVKKMIRKYGGYGYSYFFNKSTGESYGCTPIELKGKNQQVGYKVKL